jgi:hypothetical protein
VKETISPVARNLGKDLEPALRQGLELGLKAPQGPTCGSPEELTTGQGQQGDQAQGPDQSLAGLSQGLDEQAPLTFRQSVAGLGNGVTRLPHSGRLGIAGIQARRVE